MKNSSRLQSEIENISIKLLQLPKGKVTTKIRNGKEYFYLAYTECGKKKTIYVKKCDIEKILNEIKERDVLRLKLKTLKAELADFNGVATKKRYTPRTRKVIELLCLEAESKSLCLRNDIEPKLRKKTFRELKEIERILYLVKKRGMRQTNKFDTKENIKMFRSSIHHAIKSNPLNFMQKALSEGTVQSLYKAGEFAKAMYVLSCIDTIAVAAGFPYATEYEKIREMRLNNPVYFAERSSRHLLPEFLKHNIYEENIDDAY